MATNTKQKEYQRNYDKKTKMISVKYALHEMDDYDRFMNYLERTGKSANGFIKELINDFFEHKKYVMDDERVADYFVDYNVSGELLDKLKNQVGQSRFDIIMDYCKSSLESQLYDTFIGRGDEFDEWIEQFLSDIKCGDIDINVSDEEFEDIIDESISSCMHEIMY